MPFEAPEFLASLRSFVAQYQGARQHAILRAPDVFELFARLFAEPELPREARGMINAVLAYFVVPDDVLPEAELGPFGLLDDLFVAAHVFRILRRELPAGAIDRAWLGEGDVDEVMDVIHGETRAELGKRTREALRLAGLA
jgi:uncharacterized membrane protein YkvA (DUF1232 family)